jgi:hypothetical protein
MQSSLARCFRGLMPRRDTLRRQLEALRERDGENCRRCRRPMRFDLPGGHDSAPKLEQIQSGEDSATAALGNLCLCHRRCNAEPCDMTVEVLDRLQRRTPPKRAKARKRAAA